MTKKVFGQLFSLLFDIFSDFISSSQREKASVLNSYYEYINNFEKNQESMIGRELITFRLKVKRLRLSYRIKWLQLMTK
jgi:hypothetical protein